MRLIHAVRELNAERPEDPIRVIALHTEPERSAMFVRHADEAYNLGPTATVDADGKRTGAYLNYEGLKQALIATQADAVWPGWGFVAEHPAFADLVEELGLVFVGPTRRRHARAGRQDPVQADGREGRGTGRAVVQWAGRDDRGGS